MCLAMPPEDTGRAEWAKIAVAAYRTHHADRIVAERNNGGAMVEATIRMIDGNVPVTTVWASRGKAARAEPVSALYEQGKVHHIGTFPSWRLLVEPMPQWGIFEYTRQCAEAIRGPTPSPPQPEYAIGCVEWHASKSRPGDNDDPTRLRRSAKFRRGNGRAIPLRREPEPACLFRERIPVSNATGPAIRCAISIQTRSTRSTSRRRRQRDLMSLS